MVQYIRTITKDTDQYKEQNTMTMQSDIPMAGFGLQYGTIQKLTTWIFFQIVQPSKSIQAFGVKATVDIKKRYLC